MRFYMLPFLAAALASCSHSEGGSKAQTIPSDLNPALVEKATSKSMGTDGGLIFLARQANLSKRIRPSSKLIDDRSSDEARESESKLNNQGLKWLRLMRKACVVSHPGEIKADRESPTQHTVEVREVSGERCPVSTSETTTTDVDRSGNTANVSIHGTSSDQVVDPQLQAESHFLGGRSEMSGSVYVVTQKDSAGLWTSDSHGTGTAAMEARLLEGTVTGTVETETVSHGRDFKQAIVVTFSTPQGPAALSVIITMNGTEYRLNGNIVSKAQFNSVFGADIAKKLAH